MNINSIISGFKEKYNNSEVFSNHFKTLKKGLRTGICVLGISMFSFAPSAEAITGTLNHYMNKVNTSISLNVEEKNNLSLLARNISSEYIGKNIRFIKREDELSLICTNRTIRDSLNKYKPKESLDNLFFKYNEKEKKRKNTREENIANFDKGIKEYQEEYKITLEREEKKRTPWGEGKSWKERMQEREEIELKKREVIENYNESQKGKITRLYNEGPKDINNLAKMTLEALETKNEGEYQLLKEAWKEMVGRGEFKNTALKRFRLKQEIDKYLLAA